MLTFSRFLKSISSPFRPPFEGLWIIVVLYFAWCFLIHPLSPVLRGNLPDPDDYMYLTQTLDWLSGQSWFDTIQYRLNPPPDGSLGGTPIHFSRLTQLPMAGLITLFELCGFPSRGAATLTAYLYPLLLLSSLLLALRWLAQKFVPKDWAGVSAAVALFALGMMFMFTPGHIDHHGLNILLITLTLGCVVRMMREPERPLWGLVAGALLALSLSVALEVLPWLLIIACAVGLWSMVKGGETARYALGFGLTLHLSSWLFLMLARRPEQWFTTDVLSYSLTYVLLTGGIAIPLAAIAVASERSTPLRWVLGSLFAGLAGFLFLRQFPELWAGPYGGMDAELAQLMLGEINESKPLVNAEPSFLGILTTIGGSFVAIPASLILLARARPEERWPLGLMSGLLLTAFLLTLFYQYRFMAMLGAFTVLPLTILLVQGSEWAAQRLKGAGLFAARALLLLLVGPLPSVLLPALSYGRVWNVGMLLFPVDSSLLRVPCDTANLERILRDSRFFGDRPRLIISSMGMGPELLFRTEHSVLAAPYHMDVTGNIDATRFFSTPSVKEAEGIARRRGAELVVACRFVPHTYMRRFPGQEPAFVEQLLTRPPPAWLKRARFPELPNFVIFEVVSAKSR